MKTTSTLGGGLAMSISYPLKPMLAHPFEPRYIRNVTYLVQEKFDGIRCLAYPDGSLRTRNNKPILSCPHISDAIQSLAQSGDPLVFDGELFFPGWTFNRISGAVRTKEPTQDSLTLLYLIFDFVSERTVAKHRLAHIARLRFTPHPACLVFIEHQQVVCTTREELETVIGRIYETTVDMAQTGVEGLILRDPYSVYEQKRTHVMLKVKGEEELIATVESANEEIDKDGNSKDTLGSLSCIDEKNNKFSVGTGPPLTKHGRKLLWRCLDGILGHKVRVKFQYRNEFGIPRHPILREILGKEI